MDGPAHDYMLGTPGCWQRYGELLTREYEDRTLFTAVHRLTVDAYALQHPGSAADRRAVQSVWLHFIGLMLARDGVEHGTIPSVLRRLAHRPFENPGRPTRAFSVTHADVLMAPASAHAEAVQAWADAAFEAWSHLLPRAREIMREVDAPH